MWGYLLVLSLCVLSSALPPFSQSSIVSKKGGALVGVRYSHYDMELVTVDVKTGDMKVLDKKLNNSDKFIFGATGTVDNNGNYYVALMADTNSQIFVVDAKSGKTVSTHNLPNIYYTLGYDTTSNSLYGVEEDSEAQLSTVYKIDPSSFETTKVASFPPKSIPFAIQSAYDTNSSIIYDMMITGSVGYYYGISVTDGKLVANAEIPMTPSDPILFNLFSDNSKNRMISISQDRAPPNQYFLTAITISGSTASLARIGTETFATIDYYPTVCAISSDLRQFYALMTNTSASPEYYDWFVIDIDTGAVVYDIHDWTDNPPVDLQYVEF